MRRSDATPQHHSFSSQDRVGGYVVKQTSVCSPVKGEDEQANISSTLVQMFHGRRRAWIGQSSTVDSDDVYFISST